MGEVRNAYKISVGKTEEKRPTARPWQRWKYWTVRKDGELTGFIGLKIRSSSSILWPRVP